MTTPAQTPASTPGTDRTPAPEAAATPAPPATVGAGPAAHGVRRQVPRWSDLRPLLQFEGSGATPSARLAHRLGRAADLADIQRLAKRSTPRAPFDYVDGAAGAETGHRRNLATFRGLELRPRVLRDVGAVDPSVELFGRRSALPFGLAPTGFMRMMHSDGEYAVGASARAHGVPFALSTMGSVDIEQLAAAEPDLWRWFQLYLWSERRDDVLTLLDRAKRSGYDVLLVTVDTAVGGLRHRDVRNGMSIPPKLTARTVLDASYRPRWWYDLLTTEKLRFATLDADAASPRVIRSMFDPTLSFADLAWIRREWPGTLVVKGILTPDDARAALDAGADALHLSNHGGRQLDRPPVPLRELPGIRAAVGPDVPIVLDSGITTGGDILAAHALGADFTMIGRAYLYGLMAGGRAGVDRVLDLLDNEVRVTMQLMGVRTIGELEPDMIRFDAGS